jgi:hypothetical protein
MGFSATFLGQLAREEVVGDFPPFLAGNIRQIENYIRKVLAQLASISALAFEADFDSYGSGFASYVEVRVSKKDQSGTNVSARGQRVSHDTTGLLLYISKLAPYWFYGGSSWSKTYEQGGLSGGLSLYLTPQSQAGIAPS